jgi:hypothetical protein
VELAAAEQARPAALLASGAASERQEPMGCPILLLE